MDLAGSKTNCSTWRIVYRQLSRRSLQPRFWAARPLPYRAVFRRVRGPRPRRRRHIRLRASFGMLCPDPAPPACRMARDSGRPADVRLRHRRTAAPASAGEASPKQATPGKRMFKLYVTSCAGERISFGTASLRYFASFLSAIPFCFGYFVSASDPQGQCWHDRLAGTVVLNRPPAVPV